MMNPTEHETSHRPTSRSLSHAYRPDESSDGRAQALLRNAATTEKRPKDPARSTGSARKISIKPLFLTNFMEELLEAEKEPLRHDPRLLDASDDDEKEDDNKIPKPDPLDDTHPLKTSPITPSVKDVLEKELETSWNSPWLNMSLGKQSTPVFAKPAVPESGCKNDPTSSAKVQCTIDMKETIGRRLLFDSVLPKMSAQHEVGDSTRKDLYESVPGVPMAKHPAYAHVTAKLENKTLSPIHENCCGDQTIMVKGVGYTVLDKLGVGGSCVVYHCYDRKARREYAIKQVDLSNKENEHMFLSEVEILARLQDCDRIVRMYQHEVIEESKVLLIVLERGLFNFSSIIKQIASTDKPLPIYMLVFYWMEMLLAVRQIHRHGIVHNDLKPSNFLVFGCCLKLIDFGISSRVPDDMTSAIKDVQIGSLNYISPEAVTDSGRDGRGNVAEEKPKYKLGYRSDVWSLGCILYQLIYRRTPFHHIGNSYAKLSVLTDPNHKIDYPELEWVPVRVVRTIQNCLKFNVKLRPSVQELIDDCESWV